MRRLTICSFRAKGGGRCDNHGHFPGGAASSFRKEYRYSKDGKDIFRDALCFRIHMLDDGFYEEWWSFSEWLSPYSESAGYVGYYREEQDWQPTLIYFKEGRVFVSRRLRAS